MTHEDAQEMLALYAVDGLESNETQAITHHVAECRTCQRDLDQYQEALGDIDLAMTRPDWSGHPEMRQEFQKRLKSVPAEIREVSKPTRAPSRWRWPVAWAATILVAIGGWSAAYHTHQQLNQSQRIMAFVTTGRPVALTSVHAVRARVDLYVTSGRAVVWVKTLPPLSSGQVYEGWWIVNGRPEDAGTFGHGATLLAHPKGATAFAITKEPEGGTKAPTTPILVLGTV